MTRCYQRELSRLSHVYDVALSIDISDLTKLIESFGNIALTTVGSGGSYSSASYAAFVHEHYTNFVGRAVTPLDVLATPLTQSGILCFSASGRNRDIATAFKSACQNEPGPIGALVMATGTPLGKLRQRFEYAQVIEQEDDSFKDGFLAVATMIASSIMIARAYETVFGGGLIWPDDLDLFVEETLSDRVLEDLTEEFFDVAACSTISLMYSPSAGPAAVDLESRFIEAALGNLHIADLRNFGHGRHHWMAKRGNETGVIAIVGHDYKTLTDRTLGHLPNEIPAQKVELKGPPPFQALSGLLTGLYISEAAGRVAKIDPGKPGVPKFGRSLYAMGPGAPRVKQCAVNRRAAIRRKASIHDLRNIDRRRKWEDAYDVAVQRFKATSFGGVVFDYDGTLCDPSGRFDALRSDVCDALRRLISQNLAIGIATGRGPSAGIELRKAVPEKYWAAVPIGYYNGGFVTTLENECDPIVPADGDDPLFQALSDDRTFSGSEIKRNRVQISIKLDMKLPLEAALASARSISEQMGEAVKVVTSGHSLDLLRTGASKCAVVSALQGAMENASLGVLRLGDKGAWPGNDADFLDHPLGLSVDGASHHMTHCWNLAPAGVRGVQATLYYLSALLYEGDGARLIIRPADKGAGNAS